jgi:hypothetical protein
MGKSWPQGMQAGSGYPQLANAAMYFTMAGAQGICLNRQLTN